MKYVRIKYRNNSAPLPNVVFSELDDGLWEKRKVALFTDGSSAIAGEGVLAGETFLGLAPFPPIDDLAREPELDVRIVEKRSFEEVWNEAMSGLKPR